MKQIVHPVELVPCGDSRGYLLALEGGRDKIPFDVKRVYFMYGIPCGAERGKHAHLDTKQVLVCVHGSFTISCEFGDGRPTLTYTLDNPTKGLYIEGFVWREMCDFAPNTVIAVLANEHYDEAAPKEIRDHKLFLEMVQKGMS